MDQPPALLTLDDFLPLVGQSFAVEGSPDTACFALVEAKSLKVQEYPGRQREAFALTFHCTTTPAEQGPRLLDLPGIGATEIFLVPIAAHEAATVYEAVFN